MKQEIETCTRVLCKSGKFETGEGTCALICMDQLGDARKNCSHRMEVFGKLAQELCIQLGFKA